MIKGVLFDMDGVLLDSEQLTSEAGIRYFAEKGFMVKHEDFFPFYGTGEKGFFGGVAEKYGIPYDNDKEIDNINRIYAELAEGNISPLPGVVGFIEICRNRGLKIAVATSAGMFKMRTNLRLLGFENIFDALVCGSDITNNKPHPEIFITAAQKLDLQPEDCLVIEDAPSGVAAAKKAGAKCVALNTSFPFSELNQADWVINDLSEFDEKIFSGL